MTFWNFFTDTSMLQNIVSELIGISVTVFLVDKIIIYREKQRTLPAKHVAYAQLLTAVNECLHKLLPIESKNLAINHVTFGNFDVMTLFEVTSYNSYETQKHIQTTSELTKSYDMPSFQKDVSDMISSIKLIKHKLDSILIKSYPIIETEFNNMLRRFEFRIDEYLRHNENPNYELDDFPQINAIFLSDIIDALVAVRLFLENSADEIISHSEKMERIKRNTH